MSDSRDGMPWWSVPDEKQDTHLDERETELPEPDEPTDWPQYTAYQCIHCYEDCINRIDSVYARARECRNCFGVPTLDRHAVDEFERGGDR